MEAANPCSNPFCIFLLQIIAYDRNRGGTIVIDKRPGGMTVTSLIISHASPGDSGSYTCDPASAYAKSIQVHVGKSLIKYTDDRSFI